MSGKMIVIDGNDGSGKQTQTELLRNHLVDLGLKVLKLSFPRYEENFFGAELRRVLNDKTLGFGNYDPIVAAVLYAADRWESKPLIMRALERGEFVVCDRYMSSNQIHQGGKISSEKKRLDFLAQLDVLEFGKFKIPRPDVCIYLDVPPAVSEVNMSEKTRDEVEKNPQYIQNSHDSAQWLIGRNPELWIHVKCTTRGLMRTREDIHREVVNKLHERNVL